jgi:ubiquinone/menaquinone biosynthesis C-methylase UbiE
MRLLIAAARGGEAEDALQRAIEERGGAGAVSVARLAAALNLIRANADAWQTVRAVMHGVEHGGAAVSCEHAITAWAQVFDRAAGVSPEAGVALYSLGDPGLLQRATAEVAEHMRRWGLIGPERALLDIGCGIGRFEQALAPQVAHITGLDISASMIAIARERCRALGNVTLLQSSGRDLASIGDGVMDVVFSVDCFPYLVHAGTELAKRHIEESARVLKPAGALLVLNFSYRGDVRVDRADIEHAAVAARLEVMLCGKKPFKLWDGSAYLARKLP